MFTVKFIVKEMGIDFHRSTYLLKELCGMYQVLLC
jgi:hypothetical protein